MHNKYTRTQLPTGALKSVLISILGLFALAVILTLAGAVQAAGNNNGPKFGGSNAQAGAAAVGVGIGHAQAGASNSNKIGVGVDVNNRNSLSNRNTNVGINSQGQSLRNVNDLSNRNVNDNHNFNRNLNENTATGGNAFSSSKGGSAHQGQGQDQGQTQGQNLVNNIVESPYKSVQSRHEERGEYRVYNTPSVNAIAAPPSAPCYVGFGASGNLPGVGFGISGSTYDKECEVRETVRLAQADSNPAVRDLASQVLQSRLNGYIAETYKEAPKTRTTESGIFALNDN